MFLHLVIHLDGGGFVYRDDHRLAAVASAHKMGDNILRDSL